MLRQFAILSDFHNANILSYNILQNPKKNIKSYIFFLATVLSRLKLRSYFINGKLTIMAINKETKTIPNAIRCIR